MADREKRMISTLGVTVLLGLCIEAGIRSEPVEFQETGYVAEENAVGEEEQEQQDL